MAELPTIAVVADAHFHDIYSDYEGASASINDTRLTLRSWKDTRRSSRVFNESGKALKTALTDIRQRGIRHVVLLGDYTDDGQIESTQRLAALLHQHRTDYDMAFFAIPGNHDFFGPTGKHQSTRFAINPGETVLVTSDAEVAATESATSVLTQKMYCEGLPASVLPMADFGLFNRSEYLHWETPFGQSDAPAARMYDARSEDGSVVHSIMDTSYLVEPTDGIWLLLIDANVFEPRNGKTDPRRKKTFLNSSDAGWNSVLRIKPYLISWIRDVIERATISGKRLFAFSHYPIIDHFDQRSNSEFKLFGNNEVVRRTPTKAVAETLLATGLNLHFGGHMHVTNATLQKNNSHTLIDIAVPSLVAFPACYKLIHPNTESCHIDTISMDAMPIDPTLVNYYRAENKTAGDADESALSAKTYGEFLYRRMRTRVKHRYLIKEWPAEIACQINNTTTADLAYFLLAQKSTAQSLCIYPMQKPVKPELAAELDKLAVKYSLNCGDFLSCSMLTLIADWYCLRQAGAMAIKYIGSRNLKLYTCLAESFSGPEPDVVETPAEFFRLFLSVLKRSLHNAATNDSLTVTVQR